MIDTVFADRDGTLNLKAPEGEYIASPAEVMVLPDVAQAIRRLNTASVRFVVVTNQRGIARGVMSQLDYESVQQRLEMLLQRDGAHIDATYVCPHDIDTCDCRKPQPGLLLRAMSEIPAISADAAVMIGDSVSDIEAGRRAGLRTVRIGSAADPMADHTALDFARAVDWLFDTGEIRSG